MKETKLYVNKDGQSFTRLRVEIRCEACLRNERARRSRDSELYPLNMERPLYFMD